MAGKAKFMIQRIIVEKTIPKILLENKPIKKMASDPRIPNSARVVVGIIVAHK